MEVSTLVLHRDEFLFLNKTKDFLAFYKRLEDILINELGFTSVREAGRSEHWSAIPKIKPNFLAVKKIDPITEIQVQMKFRFKQPNNPYKRSPETYFVQLTLNSYVVSKYPEESYFQRTSFYRWIISFSERFIYFREKEKLKEEAIELAIAISERFRAIYGLMPSIGRSGREHYNPPYRS